MSKSCLGTRAGQLSIGVGRIAPLKNIGFATTVYQNYDLGRPGAALGPFKPLIWLQLSAEMSFGHPIAFPSLISCFF